MLIVSDGLRWQEVFTGADPSLMNWLAVMGPDTPALGERTQVPPITQAQIAATVAALLGRDWQGAVPAAAPPIEAVLGHPATQH